MKDYSLTDDTAMLLGEIKRSVDEYIEKLYEHGFRQGYKDAMCDFKDEYNRGLNDAWEASRKLAISSREGGLDAEIVKEIFDGLSYYTVLKDVSASEAIAKIKEYEEKQKQDTKQEQDTEIKVGDEVVIDDSIGIVTRAFPGAVTCYVMRKDGSSGEEDRNDCKTTGRHFDAIAEVLAEMRGESK